MTDSMLPSIHIVNGNMIYGPNNSEYNTKNAKSVIVVVDWQNDFYATMKIDQKYFPPW